MAARHDRHDSKRVWAASIRLGRVLFARAAHWLMTALQPKRYRAIWISDIHLGTRGCKAEYLLDFLRWNESEFLYLVGEIVDGWRLRKSWYWPQAHNDVIQKILRKARKGTKVFYIPGNHERLRDGKRFLILHGDDFDGVARYARWLALLGDRAYDTAIAAAPPGRVAFS